MIVILTALVFIPHCLSNNIDVQSPVIIKGPQTSSLFGYSLLQHQLPDRLVYLVGAPRAQTSQNLTQPGAVYSCEVKFGELKTWDRCKEWLSVFDDTDDAVLDIPIGESDSKTVTITIETKSGQFLGVSLARSGSSVVGCAHLYKDHYALKGYRVERRLPIGRCSVISADLTTRQGYLTPCINIADSHESYGACLAGTSISQNDGNILISAPYANGGHGNSFLYNNGVNTTNIVELFGSTWSGTKGSSSQITNDYAGYSSVYCDVNGDGVKELILGMPRSYYYKGSIRVHYGNKESQANGGGYEDPSEDPDSIPGGNLDTIKFQNLRVLCPTDDGFCTVPQGDHMGSYFGHTLACADLNNDGLDDLVISAPYFSGKISGNNLLVDRGKIVIYFGRNESDDYAFMFPYPAFSLKTPMELMGSEVADGLFGYSLNTDGDLNKDGIKDLIVGAPFEEGGGALYVFNGGDGFFDSSYSQKITPLDIGEDLQSFGSSLASGMNMDKLGGDDVLVGAFMSDTVVALRTVPLVAVVPLLILLHPVVYLENATYTDPSTKEKTVGNTLRVNISTVGVQFPRENVTLNWKLILDPTNSDPKDKRVYMKLSSTSREVYELTGAEKLQSDREITLPGIVNIFLKREIIRNFKDLFIEIEGSFETDETFSSRQALKYELFRAAKIPINIATPCDKITGLCDCDVGITALDISSPQGYNLIVIGEVKTIFVDVIIVNRGPKPAYHILFEFTKSFPLVFYDYEVADNRIKCEDNYNNKIRCELAGTLGIESRDITLMFSVNNTILEHNMIEAVISGSISVQLPSLDSIPANNILNKTIEVKELADIRLVGGARREKHLFNNKLIQLSTPSNFKSIGPEVRHILEVRIEELADIAVIEDIVLRIKWPLKHKQKFVLYLTEVVVPTAYKDMVTCDGNLVADPLGLGPDPAERIRKKTDSVSLSRDRSDDVLEEPVSRDRSDDVLEQPLASWTGGDMSVDCNTDPCHVIQCHITRLERGSNIKAQVRLEIRSRLWESTFSGYYRVNVTSVSDVISVGGGLQLPHRRLITKHITSKFYVPNSRKGVNLLIILLAVLGGLLILALIVFVLWKNNFFKTGMLMRRTPEHLFQTGFKSETLNRQVFTAS